jgi:PIN domain nuclease of toxin-antitoxin system
MIFDTHAIIWLLEGNPNIGPVTRRLADEALAADRLSVSAISFLEISTLARQGRLRLDATPAAFRAAVLGDGLVEIPVTGDIWIAAGALRGFQGDPADRIIAATALAKGLTLATADETSLGGRGAPARHDARD